MSKEQLIEFLKANLRVNAEIKTDSGYNYSEKKLVITLTLKKEIINSSTVELSFETD